MLDTCLEDMCIPREIRASVTMRHYLANIQPIRGKKVSFSLKL